MSFKDYFSQQASDYAQFRPHYPAALFAWLAAQAGEHGLAWDCATGNGQAARGLKPYFEQVVATDASAAQIAQVTAAPEAGLSFRKAPAERSGLDAASVDLISVAQALHWFDRPAFYAEAERVLTAGGVLAVWSYGLARITPEVDEVVEYLYADILGPYWPVERALVEEGYRSLALPWTEFETPYFEMSAEWSLAQLAGYLGSWSAVQRYRESRARDPLLDVAMRLTAAWGDADQRRRVRWPLAVRSSRR